MVVDLATFEMNSTQNIPNVTDDIGCWRRIGVWGSERPRCIELEKVVHCRNCAVFAQAAREVFERRLQTSVSAPMPPLSAVTLPKLISPLR